MACLKRRKCINDPNKFCYICGELTFEHEKRAIDKTLYNLYHAYFGMPLGDQDKEWTPHIVCQACFINLYNWACKKLTSLPFGIPMVW